MDVATYNNQKAMCSKVFGFPKTANTNHTFVFPLAYKDFTFDSSILEEMLELAHFNVGLRATSHIQYIHHEQNIFL